MDIFNKNSRKQNAIKTSFAGVFFQISKILLGFGYRTVFIHVLPVGYLGIGGLFANILEVLSLAELGITSAITFRFYEPISKNDVQKVGQLMNFYRRVYQYIAFFVFSMGMSFFPFLDHLIKDSSEVPADINLQLVYILCLLQSVTTYLFSYRHTMFTADQRNYIPIIVGVFETIGMYFCQILVLVIWRNYVYSLLTGIVITVVVNIGVSVWAKYEYKPVFDVKESLDIESKKQIYADTKATMIHKIGYTLLNSTDNLILTKMVGIIATGMYSNYALLIKNTQAVVWQALGNLTSIIGNAHVELTPEKRHQNYQRLLFINLWISGLLASCYYILMDDFIVLWIGNEYTLGEHVVLVLASLSYIETSRFVTTAQINASGLFVRDRWRSVLEAIINLVVSIILTNMLGIMGVFLGTMIAHLSTSSWRDPYLLYKYEFMCSWKFFWRRYLSGIVSTLCITLIIKAVKTISMEYVTYGLRGIKGTIIWLIEAIITVVLYNIFMMILMRKEDSFLFYRSLIRDKLCDLKRR